MVEVNYTLIIQTINFLVMLWFLNRFIFKPVLKHIDERDRKMGAMSEEVEDLAKRGEAALAKYETEIREIRREASEAVSSARQESLGIQAKILDEARADFKKTIDKSRKEMEKEVSIASESLKKDLDRFAGSLAEKILGRKVT